MTDRILVLIPCYNCAPQVPRVLAQFQSGAAAVVDTVLVLDNGSRDGTREAAIEAARQLSGLRVMVARNRANVNLGGSHKAAFRYALENGFTHVLVLHGDDQGNVLDLLPALQQGLHRRHDAVLGARFAKGSRLVGYSAFRIFGNRVFNLMFSVVLRRQVLDLGSGLNIFGRRVMSLPALSGYADDLRFNVFLLMDMLRLSLDIRYEPISWREDDQVSNVKMTSQALRTVRILFDAVRSPAAFWRADHRDTAHAEYTFDVLWQSPDRV